MYLQKDRPGVEFFSFLNAFLHRTSRPRPIQMGSPSQICGNGGHGLLRSVAWRWNSDPFVMRSALLFWVIAQFLTVSAQTTGHWKVDRSIISFTSDAPLELIKAENINSTGLLDPTERTFAMVVPIADFVGFNAPLQAEHFNENYMVSRNFPKATFAGRIIESIDLLVPGTHLVRAKGKLTIHGFTTEQIIPCKLVVSTDAIRVTSTFPVAIEDYGIRVPRLVQQKIASVVEVKVDAIFKANGSEP